MGWRQILRELECADRHSKRAAVQHHRQWASPRHQIGKLQVQHAEWDDARGEITDFEIYLNMLASVHKFCGETWDWERISNADAPVRPLQATPLYDVASAALRAYAPRLLHRLLGEATKRIGRLERAVQRAVEEDSRNNDNANLQYRQAVIEWDISRKIAAGVLRRDPKFYREALRFAAPFEELGDLKTNVRVEHADVDHVVMSCFLQDQQLVPAEDLELTPSGKVTRKSMPTARYWGLYQDYVCSCALRVARETLAVLPVERVAVNVSARHTDSSTGLPGRMTILAAIYARRVLASLNMDTFEPSDSVRYFEVRMKLSRTSGFDHVDPITADEQWISMQRR